MTLKLPEPIEKLTKRPIKHLRLWSAVHIGGGLLIATWLLVASNASVARWLHWSAWWAGPIYVGIGAIQGVFVNILMYHRQEALRRKRFNLEVEPIDFSQFQLPPDREYEDGVYRMQATLVVTEGLGRLARQRMTTALFEINTDTHDVRMIQGPGVEE